MRQKVQVGPNHFRWVDAPAPAKPRMTFDQLARVNLCQKAKAEGRPCNEFSDVGRELIPGVRDPIPEPELAPVPVGWACQLDVRNRHVAALREIAGQAFPPPVRCEGDGIVFVGGGRYWPMLTVAIRMCRDVCSLPIQVWYRGAEEPIDPEDLADVAGVTFHDSSAVKPTPRILRGWEAKSVALIHCGLARVCFLDADAYLLQDPAPLFDLASEHRFVFWSDMPDHDYAVGWHWFGIDESKGQAVPCVQGGQLFIDRLAFWRELVISFWLNCHSDYSYHFTPGAWSPTWHGFGDQDQFRVALALTGGSHHCLGRAPWVQPAFIYQHDGKPFCLHRCQSKGPPFDAGGIGTAPHLPGEERAAAHLSTYHTGDGSPGDVFARVYRRSLWAANQRSGAGSTPEEAAPYLTLVNALIAVAGWRTVVDVGCGDGYITTRLQAELVVGVDCYNKHIARLRSESPQVCWLTLDFDRDRVMLPAGDVCVLKDVLQHTSSAVILDWIAWARASKRWRWLLLTNDFNQTTDDCPLGGYRGLSLVQEPLSCIPGLTLLSTYLGKSVILLACEGSRERDGMDHSGVAGDRDRLPDVVAADRQGRLQKQRGIGDATRR